MRASRLGIVLVSLFAGAAGIVLAVGSGSLTSAATDLPHKVFTAELAADSAPAPSPTSSNGLACGEERWDVKTLSDPAAGSVSFAPQDTTVNALRSLPKPSVGQSTPRMAGAEMTTYRVTANLVEFKQEDDRDIHLVIADPSNAANMMIVEFPDVACEGAIDSAKKADMQSARNAFVAACGNPSTSTFKNISGTATLTGVAFFDILHGQTGVAPNGIELHPLFSFSGTCSGSGATPTATAHPSPSPTASSSAFSLPTCYQPGANTCNCPDFTTHAWAQWFHDNYDPTDINKLDSDHDGVVCESLP